MNEFTAEPINNFEELLEILDKKGLQYDKDLLDKAYEFCKLVHKDMMRKSGESYIDHCLHVAGYCAQLQFDSVTIACALLHDAVEKGGVTIDEIDEKFGTEVSFIIDGLTQVRYLSKNYTVSDEDKQDFNKLIFNSSEDIRIIVIRILEKMDNLFFTEGFDIDAIQASARKTLNIYAPIAEYLGLSPVQKILEDESFKFLYEREYNIVFEIMQRASENFHSLTDEFEHTVGELMKEYRIDSYEFYGRRKGIYSAYKKIKAKYLKPGEDIKDYSIEDLKDVFAFRLIVDSVEHCYLALGLLHARFEYSQEDFKDYISRPKENGYKSIHTVLQFGQTHIEVQIRTREMHDYNEYGPASHIAYKLSRSGKPKSESYTWTKDLLKTGDKTQLTRDDFRIKAFQDSIFVFTPKGLVIRLPKDASPIDFAFRVHTNIGLRYQGALVNGKMEKMNYALKTGDVVEIITIKKVNVSPDWIKYAKSPSVRGHIRKYLNMVKD